MLAQVVIALAFFATAPATLGTDSSGNAAILAVGSAGSPAVSTTAGGISDSAAMCELPKVAVIEPEYRLLPLSRNPTGALSLSPSVGDPLATFIDPSISGGTPGENRWMIDGIDVRNAFLGTPGAASEYGTYGLSLTPEFFDSISVSGGDFDAGSGDALGGVIDLNTISGTNVYRGSVFTTAVPLVIASGQRNSHSIYGAPQYGRQSELSGGALVSGPVLRDRIWFSAGAAPSSFGQEVRAPAGAGFPLTATYTQSEARVPWFANLKCRFNSMDSLEVSGFGDDGSSPVDPQSGYEVLAANTLLFRGIGFGLGGQRIHYAGNWGAYGADASVTRATSRMLEHLHNGADTARFSDYRDPNGIVRGGGLGIYDRARTSETRGARVAVHADFESVRASAGVEIESSVADEETQLTGAHGATFTDGAGQIHEMQTGVIYTLGYADDGVTPLYRVIRGIYQGATQTAHASSTALFGQVHAYVFDAGLRATTQRIAGSGPGAGAMKFGFETGLAPRLGVTVPIGHEAQGTVAAHASRYVEQVPLWIGVNRLSTRSTVTRVDYDSPDFSAANQIPDGTVPENGDTTHFIAFTSTPEAFRKGSHPTTEDELTAKVSWQFASGLDVSARAIHRSLRWVLEDFQSASYEDILAGAANPGPFTLGNPGSAGFRAPKRDYDALELVAERPFARTGVVSASWRISRLRGNYEGTLSGSDYSERPNATSAFDFPNSTGAMGPGGSVGPLPQDRTHVVRVSARWRSARGVGVGSVLRLASGTPRTTLDSNPFSGETLVGVKRGDLGREPGIATLDVHADYALAIRRQTLTAALDVFNLIGATPLATHDDLRTTVDMTPTADYRQPQTFVPPRLVRISLRLEF